MMTNKTNQKNLQEIIRVDHAGEYGAKVIYAGQIAALKLKKDFETVKLVQHMKKQEDEHFEYFDNQVRELKVRPTIMQPAWMIGGFAMGFLTALVDKRAAMACTTAVEEVIDEHYQSQLENLGEESELSQKIRKFRDEEIEHRDIGYENDAAKIAYFRPLTSLIKIVTKGAIAISKKL
jgi:ubiquinone biosynthesis monooxygenase Coq7